MNQKRKTTLAGNELFKIHRYDAYEECHIDYSDSLNVIGVATKKDGDTLEYYVYRTGEHGSVDWEYPCDSFDKAVSEAKKKFRVLLAYLEEVRKISDELELKRKSKELPLHDHESVVSVRQSQDQDVQLTVRYRNGQIVILKNAYAGYSKGKQLKVIDNRKVKYRKEYCIVVADTTDSRVRRKIPTKYLKEHQISTFSHKYQCVR